ncbi:hypothetical protein PAHAL_8G109000 [Panicum hallii]|uniref:Uncharacterized protein n=1 Tax=Panicum hallii TaxID=206008 RepID=A0A2T8I8F6_9POAL|nr:hypothetical protein PAHAL_8G109000 [Panicum hallii]PVH33952.1 hypothetical protein PAHAL_8G109000 [Panicum hallii]PVH33953.1 hypothetical protein PAHAL_8G109000 [Panicum hallii]PVH33954.1 hypothetical protein PAHAL_8G109000 [Panicum hallii]
MPPPPPAASRPSSAGAASGAALSPGAQLHAQDLVGGRLPDATLDTTPSCSAAAAVFDAMPSPSMRAYNVLLAASPPVAALEILARLLGAGHRPDRYAVPAVLRAPTELRDAGCWRRTPRLRCPARGC